MTSKRLEGRRAFITGGSSGIGAACATLFAAEGAVVTIASLESTSGRAESVVAEIEAAGGSAHFVTCDVASHAATAAAVAEACRLMGGIDTVVTSAGVASHPDHPIATPLIDTTAEHWHHVLDINLTGTLYTAQLTARAMIEHGGGGSIITLASVAAKRPTRGVYSVSKAGVWMLTRALSMELGRHAIRVNAIGPGVIETPMLVDAEGGATDDYEAWKLASAATLPLGRLGQPVDVARVALFLASDDSAYLTGSLLHPDGGLANSRGGG